MTRLHPTPFCKTRSPFSLLFSPPFLSAIYQHAHMLTALLSAYQVTLMSAMKFQGCAQRGTSSALFRYGRHLDSQSLCLLIPFPQISFLSYLSSLPRVFLHATPAMSFVYILPPREAAFVRYDAARGGETEGNNFKSHAMRFPSFCLLSLSLLSSRALSPLFLLLSHTEVVCCAQAYAASRLTQGLQNAVALGGGVGGRRSFGRRHKCAVSRPRHRPSRRTL